MSKPKKARDWSKVECPIDGFGGYVSFPQFTMGHFRKYRDIDSQLTNQEGEGERAYTRQDGQWGSFFLDHWVYVSEFCNTSHLEGFNGDWLYSDVPPDDAPYSIVQWLIYITMDEWREDVLSVKNS